MTLMLNNEWQGKYTHQRLPAIIFLTIGTRKQKLAGKNTCFAQNHRFPRMAVCGGKPYHDWGKWLQLQTCTHDDSGVVPSDRDVLCAGGCRQAEDEDEHRHNQQHPRHDDGFPLPLFEGAWEQTHLDILASISILSFVLVNFNQMGQKTFSWSRLTPFKDTTLPTSALSERPKELFCCISTFEGGLRQGNSGLVRVQEGGVSLKWKRCTFWHHRGVNSNSLFTSLYSLLLSMHFLWTNHKMQLRI